MSNCANALSSVAAMLYPCLPVGMTVDTEILTEFSQKVLKETKLLVLLASLPWRIHILYSLGKSPVQLSMCTPMLMVS